MFIKIQDLIEIFSNNHNSKAGGRVMARAPLPHHPVRRSSEHLFHTIPFAAVPSKYFPRVLHFFLQKMMRITIFADLAKTELSDPEFWIECSESSAPQNPLRVRPHAANWNFRNFIKSKLLSCGSSNFH